MRRAFALVLAALCALLQLGTVLHGVLVAHVVCPEHGELTHASTAHERGTTHVEGATEEVPTAAPPTASHPDEDEHAHDHCRAHLTRGSVAKENRTSRGWAARAVLEAAPLPVPALREALALRVTRARRLLEAPKNSPPRGRIASV
ncbi:MAG: hypothetical protein FJ096_20075 [Deltaproteobacteria bacterium]|nr:hypothetical protein [Deltaproteobacteria bacterium]